MKILFDTLGSTEKSGGMRLHATELLRAWSENFPNDEIHVLGGRWVRDDLQAIAARLHVWDNERILGRASGQLLNSAAVAARNSIDALISLSPIVSPLPRRIPVISFQHDWRHKKNPTEFPAAQRIYRSLWQASARWSTATVCISKKTERETLTYAPQAKVKVIENGRDHARSWVPAPASRKSIVTFGHHNNKRPELVIAGFASVSRQLPPALSLTVLGARGRYAEQLRQLADSLGVGNKTILPGFVSDPEYQALLQSAAAVVMASSDEGFGLPIAEAEYFGIPAIITTDSGMDEIFGGYPTVANPTSNSIGEKLIHAIASERDPSTPPTWTWRDAAAELRHLIESNPQR